MIFNGIEYGGKLGGYTITNHSATKLPQPLASAVGKLTSGELAGFGARYTPIWYLGAAVTNGKNYALVCEQLRTTKNATKKIVVVIVNIPPSGATTGEGATISQVIDENTAIFDDELLANFKKANAKLTGVEYTPILLFGQQVAKGMNYYIVSQAQVQRPGTEAYGVMVKMNVFQNDATFVDFKRLK